MARSVRPNILYVHSHDTGRHIQPYGYPVPTPNLQRLADQGVVFRNAFCVSPTCSPARAGLLTGQYPHQCGQWGLSNRGYPLEHPERHLVQTLRHAGYHTALVGVQHVAADERDLGYDHVREDIIGGARGVRDPQLSADSVSVYAQRWLEQHQDDDRLWFLDAGMVQTHSASWRRLAEHEVPTHGEEDRVRPPAILPDVPEARHFYARFRAVAVQLDRGVGRILDTLDHLGLADNTLVVYTTDHGIGLPAAKCSLFDAGLEVGLILRGPARAEVGHRFDGGRTIYPVVSHLDVFPTLCDVLGIEQPDWLEGRSLLPLVRGETDLLHEQVFGEINVHGEPQPERCVRTDRYKLIRRWWTDPQTLRRNFDNKPIHLHQHTVGWPQRLQPGRAVDDTEATDVLFDLMLDPTERCDRSGDSEYAGIYADLSGRLDTWMRATDDALVGGAGGIPEPGPFTLPDPSERR